MKVKNFQDADIDPAMCTRTSDPSLIGSDTALAAITASEGETGGA